MLSYQVRESRRVRRVILRVEPHVGLVLVVPPGYDRRLISPLINRHAEWIRTAITRLGPIDAWDDLPQRIELAYTDEHLQVIYRGTEAGSTSARQKNGPRLVVTGAVDDREDCRRALRRWLSRCARRELLPLLESLAAEMDLPYEGCSVRLQRSRWGSCSPRRAISLNASLLFLPPHIVRYVLVHELCHTKRLDHSPRFWKLVARHDPAYRERRRELASLRHTVPSWVHPQRLPAEVGTMILSPG